MMKLLRIFIPSLLMCAFLLGGCDNTATTTETTARQESTGPAGELIYVANSFGGDDFGPIPSLPPAWIMITNERMIRYNYDDEPTGYYPLLAESYSFSPDYLTMDVYLRKGIQWQGNYGELTADDLEYTFSVVHADANLGSNEAVWYGPPEEGGFIKSTEVIDNYHWRMNFSKPPYAAWFADLSTNYMQIICKKYFETVGYDEAISKPIGTGPWQLMEHVPGSHMKFEVFDNYWGPKPSFKYLTIRSVPEAESQLAMLKTGEADLAAITADKIAEAEAAGLRVKEMPEAQGVYLSFGGQLLASDPKYDPTVPWASHTDEPEDSPWNQRALKVRQALNLAIDRNAILSKIMYGGATPMTTYFYPPSSPGFKSEWQEYPYDPSKAKQLLSDAGYPNGFEKPIKMYVEAGSTFSGPYGSAMALAISSQLEDLGLKVERLNIESMGWFEVWPAGHEDAWCMAVMMYPNLMYPGEAWYTLLDSGSIYHDAFMSPQLDEVLREYNDALPKGEAEQLMVLQEGTNWIYDNYMVAPIAYTKMLYAYAPKVGDIGRYEKHYTASPSSLNFEFIARAE